MKILLVYPNYPETFWSFKHAIKFISRKAAFPPLGLLTVASLLPLNWEKRLVDTNVSKLKNSDIEWADMVFISAMIIQKDSAIEIARICKSKGKKVVAGGPYFTTSSGKFENIDHLILDEAESTLPMFLRDLREGTLKACYSSQERPNIHNTPIPQWNLINIRDYACMPVQYSRGCPFNCEFCDIVAMNGHITRTKNPRQMLAEMQALYDTGWRGGVFIVDDNFIGNKSNVKEMLSALMPWQKLHHYPFRFTTEASVNLSDDDELMHMMSDANFDKVFLGLESPDKNSLRECGKAQNASHDLVSAIRKIQANGMQVMGGFIVGFDNDTDRIFDNQIRFIQKTGVVTAMVGTLNVLPRTRLWDRLKSEGRLVTDTTGDNTGGQLNFEPKMGRSKLKQGYKNIMATIYSPKQYYARIDTFLKHYCQKSRGKITLSDISAFLKSIWAIGIKSRARLYYWRLLIKVSFSNHKALPDALELAIYGQHFQKIVKRINAA